MKLKQALDSNLVKRLQHMVFVGVITTEECEEGQFAVQCVSPIPKAIQDVLPDQTSIFIGAYANKQNERVLAIVRKDNKPLHDYIFSFRIRYTYSSFYIELLKAKQTEAAPSYKIIPVPQLGYGETRDGLERKLSKGYISFVTPKYPNDFGVPELLCCEGRLYGNLSLKSSISSIMYWEHKREVVYMEIDNWEHVMELDADGSVYFVKESVYEQLKRTLHERGQKLIVNESKQSVSKSIGDEQEVQFLQYVKESALQKGLYVEEIDVYNLHVCLKTSLITVVGGMPGIGKSQLVKLYGESLGLQYGKHLLWVPISPSYQEPSDLLGYYHPNGTYIESETGMVRTLLAAEQNPDQLYFIVFDEMNVSYIEHWFTPFLSLLELDEESRRLTLYSARLNTEDIPSSLIIRNNVRFIGTVNFDETTKELSERLLDRMNVVTFRKLPFREAFMMEAEARKASVSYSISAAQYNSWSNEEYKMTSLTEEELDILDSIHAALHAHDPSKGVSFRTAAAIAGYMSNIPKDGEGKPIISRDEAFDLQVKQRILTKIRGMETAIGPILSDRTGSLLMLLQGPLAKEVSSFSHSLACMQQKVRELELYGYAK